MSKITREMFWLVYCRDGTTQVNTYEGGKDGTLPKKLVQEVKPGTITISRDDFRKAYEAAYDYINYPAGPYPEHIEYQLFGRED